MSEWREDLETDALNIMSDRAAYEREGREELAAERVERGAAWLADQGFNLTDLGPGKYIRTRYFHSCPLGLTIGYWPACERAIPGRWDTDTSAGWTDRAEAWAEQHGFTTHNEDVLTAAEPRWEDLDTAWQRAIDRAHAEADAVDMAR